MTLPRLGAAQQTERVKQRAADVAQALMSLFTAAAREKLGEHVLVSINK